MKVSQVAATATLVAAVQAQADLSCSSFFTDTCLFQPFTSVAINSFSCASDDFGCYCSNSFGVAGDVGFLDACTNGADSPETYGSFCSCVAAATDVISTTTSDEVTTTTDTGIVIPTDTDTGIIPTDTDTGIIPTDTDTGVIPPIGTGTSTGGPGSSKVSTSGSGSTGTKSNGITPPGASPTLSGTSIVPIGSATKTSMSIPVFTGAAGTASAFMPIGGVLGAVAGLIAYL